MQTLIIFLESIVIYAVCYLIASLICSFIKKYNKIQKKNLLLIITNAICFVFFIIYGLADNYLDARIEFLEPLWFLLTPISFIGLIYYSISFFASGSQNGNVSN